MLPVSQQQGVPVHIKLCASRHISRGPKPACDGCWALTQKKAGFPCSGLNTGSYFISHDEGMAESPVETLEKAIVLHHFWTEGLTSF